MRRRDFSGLLTAAIVGISRGARVSAQQATAAAGQDKDADGAKAPKHVCKGLNECRGQGQCKHGCGNNGCAGKNDCKGKGGCAAKAAHHECRGKNSCKGIGGCATGDKGCAGRNTCKAKGGCEVPLKIEHTKDRQSSSAKSS